MMMGAEVAKLREDCMNAQFLCEELLGYAE